MSEIDKEQLFKIQKHITQKVFKSKPKPNKGPKKVKVVKIDTKEKIDKYFKKRQKSV